MTYSVRDTEINGVKIAKDDFIGITKGEICISTKTRQETTEALIKKLVDEDSEIITLFYRVKMLMKKSLKKSLNLLRRQMLTSKLETVNGKQDISYCS